MIRGSDFILNPNKLEEQFQLVEVSDCVLGADCLTGKEQMFLLTRLDI